ncbi:MAG: hypothetical protein GX075_04055 [Firmicutes bacterium]|nr:hypothetical protein [Bacillota bacterium]
MKLFERLRIDSYSTYSALLRLGAGVLFRSRTPTDREVIRKLHQILGTYYPEWLDRINFDFLKLFVATRRPALLLISGVLLLGVWFLVRGLVPYLGADSDRFRTAPGKPFKKTPPAADGVTLLFREALDQAGAGDYRRAIISLHKATIEYLINRVIPTASGKKYSNNDFKKKLQSGSTLYRPFALIADYAEIAAFSAAPVSRSDFQTVLEAFEKNFL